MTMFNINCKLQSSGPLVEFDCKNLQLGYHSISLDSQQDRDLTSFFTAWGECKAVRDLWALEDLTGGFGPP